MQPEEQSIKVLFLKQDIKKMKILRLKNHQPFKIVPAKTWYKYPELQCSEESSTSVEVVENEHSYSKGSQDVHFIDGIYSNLVDSQRVKEETVEDSSAANTLEDVLDEEIVVSELYPENIEVNEEILDDTSAAFALEDVLDEEIVVSELYPENIEVNDENQEDAVAAHSLEVILNEEVELCPEKKKVHKKRISFVDRASKVSSEQLLCEICGRVLGSRQALRKHIKSQHLNVNPPGKILRKRVDIILPEVNSSRLMGHLPSTNIDQQSTSISHFSNTITQIADSTIQPSSKSIDLLSKTISDTFGQSSETISSTLDEKSSRISLHVNPDSKTNEDNIVTMYKCEADSSSGPNKTYFCDICGKGFTSKYRLRTHKSFHTDIRPFGCQYCPKTFKTKGQKQTHERRHFKEVEKVKTDKGSKLEESNESNNVKKEICDLCGQLFVNKYVLATHKKFHSGIRPYSCRLCAKTFKTKGQVKVHENRHIL